MKTQAIVLKIGECAITKQVIQGLGFKLVVDPFGRLKAEVGINECGVIMGEVITAQGDTLYSRWGEWFGWLTVDDYHLRNWKPLVYNNEIKLNTVCRQGALSPGWVGHNGEAGDSFISLKSGADPQL